MAIFIFIHLSFSFSFFKNIYRYNFRIFSHYLKILSDNLGENNMLLFIIMKHPSYTLSSTFSILFFSFFFTSDFFLFFSFFFKCAAFTAAVHFNQLHDADSRVLTTPYSDRQLLGCFDKADRKTGLAIVIFLSTNC